MQNELSKLAFESNPLIKAVRGDLRPVGWIGDAFCSHVYNASLCNLSDRDFPGADEAPLRVVNDYQRGVASKNGLQKRLFHAIHSCNRVDWLALLNRRTISLGISPNFRVDPSLPQSFVQVSKRLPLSAKMAIIKTWTNGLATSRRFHESSRLPCIFGCGQEDTLLHYLRCECLWPLVLSAISAHKDRLLDGPELRACLVNVSLCSISGCWCAFQLYHALKIQHRELIDQSVESGAFFPVWLVSLELLSTFVT